MSTPNSARRSSGSLFIVAAPSGAGKSSLVNALLQHEPGIRLSISSTTRPPRPGEQDGREYHFLSVEEFLSRRERGDFLESAEVHGNYYGTSRRWIADQLAAGTDVLLEIDWQGARQVSSLFADAVGIFILPPSLEILEERLRKRGQDAPEVIARRLSAARGEMAHAAEFDYVIINQDFAIALQELAGIVSAARLRSGIQAVRHAELFERLGIGRLDSAG